MLVFGYMYPENELKPNLMQSKYIYPMDSDNILKYVYPMYSDSKYILYFGHEFPGKFATENSEMRAGGGSKAVWTFSGNSLILGGTG